MRDAIGKFRIIRELRPYLGHGPSDVNAYVVRYDSNGLGINGWLYEPSSDPLNNRVHPIDEPSEPGAAIICGHGGVGGIPAHYDVVFRRLAKAGWTVAAPSYRGEDGSGGEIEFAHGEVKDTIACMEAVKELPGIDPDKIWLMGSSHGAMVSLLASAEASTIPGVVAISGIYDLKNWLDRIHDEEHLLMHDPVVQDLMRLDDNEIRVRSAVNVAGKIKVPVLLVHGGSDMIVPHEQSILMESALNESGNQSCRLHIEPGSDHEFVWGPERDHARNAWKEIAMFLRVNTR